MSQEAVSHRKKKILCVPLITSHMILKGITKLECTKRIPSTPTTSKLVKPLIYIALHFQM